MRVYWIDEVGQITEGEVQRAMRCVTAKQAEVLGLWLNGTTQKEIAEELHISQPAVNKRIRRGLQRIRGYIELYN